MYSIDCNPDPIINACDRMLLQLGTAHVQSCSDLDLCYHQAVYSYIQVPNTVGSSIAQHIIHNIN